MREWGAEVDFAWLRFCDLRRLDGGVTRYAKLNTALHLG
jgi:hypothetical protein